MKTESKTALELMRLEGICKLILDHTEEDTLENHYISVTKKSKVDNITKAIKQCTKAQLIEIISRTNSITDELILQYFNDYRYGRKPGFILYWANGFANQKLDKTSIQLSLTQKFSLNTYKEDQTFKNLKCLNVIKWKQQGINIFEICMSYSKKYNYIDESQKFNHIYESVECFAWLCPEKGFIALYNTPPYIEMLLKKAFFSLYSVKMIGLTMSKNILDKIFNPSNRKKVSLTQLIDKPDMPKKASFSGDNFADNKIPILSQFEDGYDLTSCLYDENIDGTAVTMGVNNNKGKLYINKNVTAEQFRQWSIETIVEIMSYFSNILSVDGIEKFENLNLFSSSEWRKIGVSKRKTLEALAMALLKMSINKATEMPIDISSLSLYNSFKSDLQYVVFGMCDKCNDFVIPKCPSCNSQNIKIVENRLLCSHCSAELRTLTCECGNNIFTNNIDDVLFVQIGDSLIKKIIKELSAITEDINFCSETAVVLHNKTLKLINLNSTSHIDARDVDEFKELYNISISTKDYDDFVNNCSNLKEKCKSPNIEKCNKCKYDHGLKQNGCLLKLFTVFDGYTPQPHQGHEFGDIKIKATSCGKKYTLQGILKSNKSNITRSSKTGREILDQTISGFSDSRVDVVAVIAPTTIDAQLTETITFLATMLKKKVMFLDRDFMLRLYTLYKNKFKEGEN